MPYAHFKVSENVDQKVQKRADELGVSKAEIYRKHIINGLGL